MLAYTNYITSPTHNSHTHNSHTTTHTHTQGVDGAPGLPGFAGAPGADGRTGRTGRSGLNGAAVSLVATNRIIRWSSGALNCCVKFVYMMSVNVLYYVDWF